MENEHARRLIDEKLAYVRQLLEHIQGGTNPAQIREAMSPFHLENFIDTSISEIREKCPYDESAFHAQVRSDWEAYAREAGGAVPSESVCDYTVIKRREIYLAALRCSLR